MSALSFISFPLKVYLVVSRSVGDHVAKQPILAHWPRAGGRAVADFGGVTPRESQAEAISRHLSPWACGGGLTDTRMPR